MKLASILRAQSIELRMRAKTKAEALRELAALAVRARPELDAEEVHRVIWEREQIGSTGLSDSIAIPHGRSPKFRSFLGCLGISQEGVDFAAMDGQKTHLFFVLLSPEGAVRDHLRAVARITRVLVNPALRDALLAAKEAEEAYQIVSSFEETF